jgi:hypothetical protein
MLRSTVCEIFLPPLLACSAMVLCAVVTGQLAHVSERPLLFPYFATSIAITFFALLLSVFWWVLQSAREGDDAPLRSVGSRLMDAAPLLLLPAVAFPLFLASFTATKTAIPFLVGYTWDPFWAHADRLIFGDDAWRIAHQWLGNGITRVLEWFYVVVWGIGFIFVMALVPLNSSARFTAKFYTAMMVTWLLGGFVLAYLLSAAGPVFAHLVSRDSSVQFADLRSVLNATLKPHGPIWTTQLYLPDELHSHSAQQGGGISAMPSMHLATVSIYVIAAWRTRFIVPALLMWLIIFVGSGYFGFHYWIDGIAAAAVAGACWAATQRLFARPSGLRRRANVDYPGGAGVDPLPSAR